jgi:hypothetical protein
MEPRALLGVAGVLASAYLTACGDPGAGDGDYHDYGAPEPRGSQTSRLVAADPVSSVVDAGCSTAPLMPLSTQLVEEIDCLSPGALIRFGEQLGDGIAAGGSVFPFLQSFAVDSLEKVIAARGTTLQLNSGLRALPQQFVLYRWYQLGRCDITLAAKPGSSNHESGLAVDVQDNAGWRPFFLAEGWKWQGETDPVHFDIQGGVDLRGLSILAFQRMWNRNHPEDPIEEDGLYGDITEGRLTRSPIGGFPIGAACDAEPEPGQGGAAAGGTAAGGTAGNSVSAGTGGDSSAGTTSSGSGGAAAGSVATGSAGSPHGAGSSPLPVANDNTTDSAGCNAAGTARSSWRAWLVLSLLVPLRRRVGVRGFSVAGGRTCRACWS